MLGLIGADERPKNLELVELGGAWGGVDDTPKARDGFVEVGIVADRSYCEGLVLNAIPPLKIIPSCALGMALTRGYLL